MRLNKFLATHTNLSRRSADTAIANGRVKINDQVALVGSQISSTDQITLDGRPIDTAETKTVTILFHKPTGYVCSRSGQGSQTIYDILPLEYHNLNPVGRLDKDSSGLLLLTNDGDLANKLTHPSFQKIKRYEVQLDKPLSPLHQQMISDHGIELDDGNSKLLLQKLDDTGKNLQVTMHEGRNRQIRRTFAALGYEVKKLHRTQFGDYLLNELKPRDIKLT